jgi:hypothetical protein
VVIFNFIAYFSLGLRDLPHVQISQVLSLFDGIPTFLLLSQDSDLVCSLLILISATLEDQFCKREALSSNPSLTTKRKKKQNLNMNARWHVTCLESTVQGKYR